MSGPLPSLDEIHARYLVNPKTGIITHRRVPGRRGRVKNWSVAGTVEPSGRRVISINGRRVYAHRLVWFVARGGWPDSIEHLDGDLDNNAIGNLVSVPKALQSRSVQGTRRRNATARIGVRKLRRGPLPYQAVLAGRVLGYFATADEAEACYINTRMNDTARGGATA